MAIETHTGTLIFGDGQVAMDDGTVLAVTGPNPCATAAGRFAKWGQTQPVTVTGYTDTVDNSPVLYVTSIQWAAQAPAVVTAADSSTDAITDLDQTLPSAAVKNASVTPPTLNKAKKGAAKAARSRSSK